jgi:hypothetical protein
MDRRSVTLDEFIASYPFWGEWEVSYTDGTHLPKNEYVKLGDITIDASTETARDYPTLPFIFQLVTGQQIESRFSELPEGEKQADRAKKFIQDELVDSLVRTGLLRPSVCLMEEQIVEMRFLEVLNRLSKDGYLILIADTSALRRAAISFLHKTLSNVLIWTVVPVFVMTEVQRQIKELNDTWEKTSRGAQPHPGKCEVLKQRPQVSCISRELNHIRQWRPLEMLTALPEHLGQSNGNSKIDRLIIESVKNLKRERGLHQGIYLLTGDKDMASLATLENQGSLYVGVPDDIPSEVSSVRYDSHNERLLLTPIHYLLWDLAQVFSTIRIENKERSCKYELVYYSQVRGGFFANEVIEIREG